MIFPPVILPVVLIVLLPNAPIKFTTLLLPYVVASLTQLNTPLPLVDNTWPAVPPVIIILPTAPRLAVVETFNIVSDADPVELIPLVYTVPVTLTLPAPTLPVNVGR